MSAQSKKRLKKRRSKRIYSVFLVLFSSIFLILIGSYKLVRKNITSAFSSDSNDLSSQGVYTILFIPDKALEEEKYDIGDSYLIVSNFDKGSSLEVNIPKDQEIDAYGKFGAEKVSDVFSLGIRYSDGDFGGGIEYFVKSLEYALGVDIDGYIYSRGETASLLGQVFTQHKFSSVLSLKFLINAPHGISSDLSLSEFISFFDGLRVSEPKYVEYSDFESSVRTFFANSELSLENKTVAVLNGAGVPGLAGFGGRVCENVGMRVIEVGNSLKTYDQSILILDDPGSATAAYLMRYFDFTKVIKKKDLVDFVEPVIDRADITIIIGLDIAEKL